MKLVEILARCEAAFAQLAPMRGQLERDCSEDTALALGRTLGALHQAKGLVERDLKLQKEQEDADA
jgi:hypothetical protein